MKLKDVLKTAMALLLSVILLSCGGGGGGNDEPVTGISGRITIGGVYFAGVTVTLSGTASASTTTNSSGYYLFTGLANGSYTITPTKTNCTFTPTDATVTFSGTNISQDFTATVTPAIAAGGNHSLALKSDGTVWAWGYNGYGQLGNGTTTNSRVPVQVSGLSGIIAIAAGGNHSLALQGNGTVWAWGLNSNGQLGIGTVINGLSAAQVSNLSGITAIAAGGSHSLALTTGGGVKAWGYNGYGQLGDNSTTRSLIAVDVIGLTSGATAITAGDSHSLALTSSGGVKAWGLNGNGQLGDDSTTNSSTPVNVYNLASGITAIAAGGFHSLALTTGGGIKSWGLNGNGQLGIGTKTSYSYPQDITSPASGVNAVAAGGYHSLALTTGGAVLAWGLNASGQLGDTTTTERLLPVSTDVLTSGVDAISAGGNHSLALPNSGGVKAWGYNAYGQLGNNSITNSLTPIDVNTF